ncbi:MAG: DUF2076 domain-containing protein [Pseudolabrys sp.]
MTPQERQLVDDLFARLASLESTPRDPDAVRTIQDGLRQAPNAVYALVQTVLVQDEALKRADERIRQLEGGADSTAASGGFLDQMRDALMGRSDQAPRGSVPSSGSRWGQPQAAPAGSPVNAPMAAQSAPAPGERGGSFLGTAAAAAAGVIGGSLLMNSIGSMFGHRGQAFADSNAMDRGAGSDTPWGNSGGELSREAGLNDIGRNRDSGGNDQRASLFGNDDNAGDGDDSDFDDGDFGGGDFGGDTA